MKIIYLIGLVVIGTIHIIRNYYTFSFLKSDEIKVDFFNSFFISGILSIAILVYIFLSGNINMQISSIVFILFFLILAINNVYYTIRTLQLKRNKREQIDASDGVPPPQI